MHSYRSPGHAINVRHNQRLTSGQGVLIQRPSGAVFGIASSTTEPGEINALWLEGVYFLKKRQDGPGSVFEQGDAVFFVQRPIADESYISSQEEPNSVCIGFCASVPVPGSPDGNGWSQDKFVEVRLDGRLIR